MDKAQAMRLHACLPDSYWEFAVQHVVHVYNRTPKQGLNWRTPHELLFKAPPMVSHLCIFRCTAYVHLPVDTHGGKLQPKSQLMIYLGTAPGNEHNYLFMHPNNVLHTYAHAVFDEPLFPRCSGAWPHKLVSGPVQPHIHSKEHSHPLSEVAGEEYEDIYQDPWDDANLRCPKTCYPLHEYLHQKFMSKLHHCLKPLQGELHALMHLLLYHTDWSEPGNCLVT